MDVNQQFEKWLKNPESLTDQDGAVMKCYQVCVIDNPDTIGNFHLINALTDTFQELLDNLDTYKI